MSMTKKGMSLIELLVAMTIFIVIILIASQTLFAAIRGNSKSEQTIKVKQAGGYVMSVMERELHSALNVQACTATRVDYTDSAGQTKYFECKDVGAVAGGYINSSAGRITPNNVRLDVCSLTCSLTPSGDSVSLNLKFTPSVQGDRPEEKAFFEAKTRILLRN